MTTKNLLEHSLSPDIVTHSFTVSFTLLAMIYVGFNRFILIPLLFTLDNLIKVIAGFWTWTTAPDGSGRANTASVFWVYFGYYFGDLCIVMYGYFILEKILPQRTYGGLLSRRVFMFIFWTLQFANFATRVAAIVWAVIAYRKTGQTSATSLQYILTFVHYVILTTIEVFTAYLLIVAFHRSRKVAIHFLGGKRLHLLKHVLLSTEIRVASLSAFYIFRAACEEPKRHSNTAQDIDDVITTLINLFPLVLVLDCILRKAIKVEVDFQAWIEKCVCVKDGSEDTGSGKSTRMLRLHNDSVSGASGSDSRGQD